MTTQQHHTDGTCTATNRPDCTCADYVPAQWWLYNSHGQRLDELADYESKRQSLLLDAQRYEDYRDDAIRQSLTNGVPVRAIVNASGLSRQRIYQIRDRTR